MSLRLFIGNYNYSSWSMVPWLILRKMDVPFETAIVDLDVPGYKERLLEISPAGTVPVLDVNGDRISDSFEIAEFCAKMVPNLWPKDKEAQDAARQAVSLVHSGFVDLVEQAPMNLRRRTETKMPQSCLNDGADMVALWDSLLEQHDGPFLFKDWSIADAFFTPAATRFESYGLPRTRRSDTYISELMSDEHFQEWESMAFIETHILPETDAVNA
jgi:glutathione S-transferase